MIDASARPLSPLAPRASPLFLREAEIRRGIELLYFGYSSMIREADVILADRGLGRAHHRTLYFIARQPGLTVSALLRLLAITKQSLSRVLADLIRAGLVVQTVGTCDRRQRLLTLTPAGADLEAELFEALKARMAAAYGSAGQEAVGGFWAVLSGLIPLGDRALVASLDRDRGGPDPRAGGE